MKATIEWLCKHAALVRLHEADDAKVGDPYVWACVAVAQWGATEHLYVAIMQGQMYGDRPEAVELKGAFGKFSAAGYRAVWDALSAEGIKMASWCKVKNGKLVMFSRPARKASTCATTAK